MDLSGMTKTASGMRGSGAHRCVAGVATMGEAAGIVGEIGSGVVAKSMGSEDDATAFVTCAKHETSVVSMHVACVMVYVWHATHLVFPNFLRLCFLEVFVTIVLRRDNLQRSGAALCDAPGTLRILAPVANQN